MNTNNNKRKLSFYISMGLFLLIGFFLGIFIGYKLELIDKIQFIKNSRPLPSQDQIYANQMSEIIKDVDFFIFESVEK